MDEIDEVDHVEEALKSDTSFQLLLKDGIFDDYFNTFLCLPVFAKRLMYRKDNGLFEIEPPVKRTTHHLLHDKVASWTRINRGPYFLKTSICNEYRLCLQLANYPTCFKSESFSEDAVLQFQKKHLSKVIEIQRFKRYLSGSIGENLIRFWLDAERFRRQISHNSRRFALRELEKKFLSEGAPSSLNISLCNNINRHLKNEVDTRTKFSTILVYPQAMVLKNLHEYWIPKYMTHHLWRRTTVFSRWGKVLKSEKKKEERTIGEKPNILTVIYEIKEKMKKQNEELKKLVPSQTTLLLQTPKEEVLCELSSSSNDDLAQATNNFEEKKDIIKEIRKKRDEQGEIEDTMSDLQNKRRDSRAKRKTKRNKKPKRKQHGMTASLKSGYQVTPKTHADTPTSSTESMDRTPLTLPPLHSPYANEPTKKGRPTTLFEALHLERDYEYEADTEDEHLSKQQQTPQTDDNEEIRLPLLDRLEKISKSFVAPMVQVNSPPPKILTPFSISFLKENNLAMNKETNKQLQLLIAALTTDSFAGQPLAEYFKKTGNEIAENNLKFWTAAHQLLSDGRSDEPIVRQKRYQALINLYLSNTANFNISLTCSVKQNLCTLLMKDIGVTRLMETCEHIAEMLLPHWEEFLRNDDELFLSYVTKYKRTKQDSRAEASTFPSVDDTEYDDPFGSSYAFEEKRDIPYTRMWRAMHLAMMISTPKQAVFLPVATESDNWTSDESDVEGSLGVRNLHLMKRKAGRQNEEKLEPMFNGTAHNYGGSTKYFTEKKDVFKVIPISEQRSRKVSVNKPPRPRCFRDILMDATQLDHFKRFLMKDKEETPLMFWMAVESMRTTCKTAKARQGRGHGILKRYFGAATHNGQDLKCSAEIIKEMSSLEKVTPAMLVSAQTCVAKSLEDKWYTQYLQTFPQDEGGMIGVTLLPAYGKANTEVVRSVKQKTRGLWRMFTRNVISFRRGIMNKDTLALFHDFLKLQHQMNIAKRSNENETSNPPRFVIGNKLVYTDKLVADLQFWSEVDRYKESADAVVLCAKLGNYTKDDELAVIKKAHTIVDCFIDSHIAPRVQINISSDLAEDIIDLVQNGIIERGLFHEAAFSTFSTLIFFWKKFCLHRFFPKEGRPSQKKRLKSNRSAQIAAKELALNSNKMKKVALPADEDCPKIMFSLQFGLRLALQRHNKKRKADNLTNSTTPNPGQQTSFISSPLSSTPA